MGEAIKRIYASTFFVAPKSLIDKISQRMEEEKTSPGGIVIPDSATEKPIKGEVIAIVMAKFKKTEMFNLLMLKLETLSYLENIQAQRLKAILMNLL